MTPASYGRSVALVAAGAVLWSLMGLCIRHIDEAGTWAILFWRSVGMVPVLLAYVALRTGRGPVAAIRSAGRPGLVAGLGLVFAFAGAIYAIQATTVANAVFLFAASPLLTALFGWLLLREPVRRATWAALTLAGVGIFVMVGGGLAAGALMGNLAALASATGFAAFTLALRVGRLSDMMPAVALGGLMSMLVAVPILGLGGGTLAVPLRDALIAMGMGAVLLAGGMIAYTIGSRALAAVDLALLTMVEVMLAPIWVWLVLSETASLSTLAGGAILLGALVLNASSGARARAGARTGARSLP